MIPVTLARVLKRLTTPSPMNTTLPGRWRNVGKGLTDVPISDPAYSKPTKGSVRCDIVRGDIVRLFTNETM